MSGAADGVASPRRCDGGSPSRENLREILIPYSILELLRLALAGGRVDVGQQLGEERDDVGVAGFGRDAEGTWYTCRKT